MDGSDWASQPLHPSSEEFASWFDNFINQDGVFQPIGFVAPAPTPTHHQHQQLQDLAAPLTPYGTVIRPGSNSLHNAIDVGSSARLIRAAGVVTNVANIGLSSSKQDTTFERPLIMSTEHHPHPYGLNAPGSGFASLRDDMVPRTRSWSSRLASAETTTNITVSNNSSPVEQGDDTAEKLHSTGSMPRNSNATSTMLYSIDPPTGPYFIPSAMYVAQHSNPSSLSAIDQGHQMYLTHQSRQIQPFVDLQVQLGASQMQGHGESHVEEHDNVAASDLPNDVSADEEESSEDESNATGAAAANRTIQFDDCFASAAEARQYLDAWKLDLKPIGVTNDDCHHLRARDLKTFSVNLFDAILHHPAPPPDRFSEQSKEYHNARQSKYLDTCQKWFRTGEEIREASARVTYAIARIVELHCNGYPKRYDSKYSNHKMERDLCSVKIEKVIQNVKDSKYIAWDLLTKDDVDELLLYPKLYWIRKLSNTGTNANKKANMKTEDKGDVNNQGEPRRRKRRRIGA